MTNASSLFRSLLIYVICVPLAIFIGYMMATGTMASANSAWPLFDTETSIIVGVLLFLLLLPLLLRWHHIWLIATWNFSMIAFFLPGKPFFWMVLAWVSLGISVVQYILNRKLKFLNVPAVTRPLIFLAVVVLITARCTGGMGLQTLGSETFGGKRYFILLSAIAGYFAMTSQMIPPRQAWLYLGFFFIGSATLAIGELLQVLPPALYFIFLLFPVSSTRMNVETVAGAPAIFRLGGLGMAGSSIFIWMLCRYGIQELFSLKRLGRFLIFASSILLGLLGGYRGVLVTFILTFAVLFYLEGLMRSRLLPLLIILFLFMAAVVLPFSDRLPLNIQRTISFLPVQIDPVAKMSADTSTEWRLRMWKDLLPQVPQYLLLGKGYAFNPQEISMIKTTGGASETEGSEIVGDYHNGPLSVIIPFGIFGAIGFLWFIGAAFRVLHRNYLFGNPEYQQINRFIFAYFIAKVIFFFLIFGAFSNDMFAFAGLLGLSISLNGGVAKPAVVPRPTLVFDRFKLHPSARRPAAAQP